MINHTLLDPLYGEFVYEFYEDADETIFVDEDKPSCFMKYFWWLYCC